MKTWHAENAVAAGVLAGAAIVAGANWHDWVAACAVFCAFCHNSIAERMHEREAAREKPEVECHRLMRVFWVSKEILFAITFIAAGLWPLLAGCALFVAYPVWRRYWRRIHPLS